LLTCGGVAHAITFQLASSAAVLNDTTNPGLALLDNDLASDAASNLSNVENSLANADSTAQVQLRVFTQISNTSLAGLNTDFGSEAAADSAAQLAPRPRPKPKPSPRPLAAPEPGTLLLVGSGLAGLELLRRRKLSQANA
jgi:hypothetical protein